ncbi:hypothetical protein A2U01_0073370, partial [Trifolium medium]|nr:hypothetical protein [Trifolium medium]
DPAASTAAEVAAAEDPNRAVSVLFKPLRHLVTNSDPYHCATCNLV